MAASIGMFFQGRPGHGGSQEGLWLRGADIRGPGCEGRSPRNSRTADCSACPSSRPSRRSGGAPP
eukprot:2775630-Heterocapsa_arctica.AAC.1